MLFDRTFRKELARSFGVTLIVLLTIVMTMGLMKTLSLAAGGRVAPQDVLLLLGYTSIGFLPIVLTLALFVAVVASLGRLYRESEMAVWQACGLPLRHFVGPVFKVALPVLMTVAAMVMVVWPWSNAQSAQLRERYEKRSDLSRVTPGQFQSSRDGSKVFFIEREGGSNNVGRNVFILGENARLESVTTAAEGEIVWEGDDRLLVLRHGQRADTDDQQLAHSLARFDEYRVVADRQAMRALDEVPPKAMGSLALLSSAEARHQGELAWRIGMVLGAANFVLLGVGLAASNPRRPNSWSLVLALLVFVVYFNLIGLSKSWVEKDKFSLLEALLRLHGPALGFGLLLLVWRDEAIRLTSLLMRRATRGQA
jgi:lipopolysaccharide export system permease protein